MKTIFNRTRSIMRKIVKHCLYYSVFFIFSWIKSIQKTVVFESYDGAQYSDNPRAISEKLHELYPSIRIVWHCAQRDKYGIVPSYVNVVTSHYQFAKELATCFCFVKNTYFDSLIKKRKRQYFIQTWHGDRSFKKVLYDATKKPNELKDEKIVDLAIAGSEFGSYLYKSAFHYYGKVLQIGMPRNEYTKRMLTQKTNIKDRINIEYNKKVLLFAPTFRKINIQQNVKQEIQIDIHQIIDKLNSKTNEWICLIRAHVGASFDNKDKSIIDISDYPDMADILAITDLLITDYSTCATDFACLGGKSIIAAFDQKEYEENERAFYYTPQEAGFFVAYNQKELNEYIDKIESLDFISMNKKVNEIYGTTETGKATEKICDIIYQHYSDL